MEQQLEERLEESRARLLAGDGPPRLLAALRDRLPDLSDNLYIVGHIPEQREDLYDVLIDAETVMRVEIPRGRPPGPVIVEEVPFSQFQTGSARSRQGFDAAVRLAWARRPT